MFAVSLGLVHAGSAERLAAYLAIDRVSDGMLHASLRGIGSKLRLIQLSQWHIDESIEVTAKFLQPLEILINLDAGLLFLSINLLEHAEFLLAKCFCLIH